jgi:hypothetical protein
MEGVWIEPIPTQKIPRRIPPSFILDREKGTVTVPHFAKLPIGEFPLEDIGGYFMKSPANQFGLLTHFLQLVVHAPGGEQPLMSFILWASPKRLRRCTPI